MLLNITDNEAGALRKDELVDWYIAQIEHEIEGQQDMIAKKTVTEKVIERLVKVVSESCLGSERLFYEPVKHCILS